MTANDIRNIALLGHGGSGKTSLAEQMLFMTKGVDRLGKTVDGNTTCDYDAEEIKRQISISLAFAPVMYKGKKINVMDAPGNFDFSGEAVCAIRAAECAVIVGNAKDGLSVGMERTWKMLGKKPRMMFINRVEEANADYAACIDAIKNKFGTAIAPIVATKTDGNKAVTVIVDLLHNKAYDAKGECAIPADMADEVEALRAELMEAAAGADEELMEKFFGGEPFTTEEIVEGMRKGVKDGLITPVFCGSAVNQQALDMLLYNMHKLLPSPEHNSVLAEDANGDPVELNCAESDPTVAYVFKTVADPFVGKLSYLRVISGKITAGASLVNARTGETEKLGKPLTVLGKKQTEAESIGAGDVGAVAKLISAKTGDTLCDASRVVKMPAPAFPLPSLFMAVTVAKKGDEGKISSALARLMEEDPTLSYINNAETHQQIIGGLGEAVCSVVSEKLPVPVRRIGVMDQFGHSGPANEVLRDYGLTADNIVNVIRDIVRPDAKA